MKPKNLSRRVWRCSQIGVNLLAALSMFLCLSCGSMLLRLGQRPDTTKLEKVLKPQISTETDVLNALGTPRGKGRVMFPSDDKPSALWYYYYEEVSFTEDRRIFLFIVFDEGRYDGYLWFSSLPGEIAPETSN